MSARDELRSKVAEVNARSRQGRAAPELVRVPPGVSGPRRCDGCWEIKQRRYRAVAVGDRAEAVRATQDMGLHLRYTHLD
ncbi:hypothetical protein GCM10010218_24050 [Streptomyces mashuensis]|uniref:Uncharacterized protein n=1 Tax=Streptomyces mashuensis TaxID=33904 RepID=A0A919ED47_9ACTN|nr:hypothetical protein [Streptomyces mashuensis]GHF42120.1 hypothetical protein GCM10010218_24050 [Streptomyces mashuensis]